MDEGHHESHDFEGLFQYVPRLFFFSISDFNNVFLEPVVSSCNIPTISLVVAQTMNPAPRPPSPSAREATQRALRRENTEELSTRDTRVLMGLNVVDGKDEPVPLDASNEVVVKADINPLAPENVSPSSPARTSAPPPPRPSKLGRMNSGRARVCFLCGDGFSFLIIFVFFR